MKDVEWNVMLSGFFSCLILLFKPTHRRFELCLYSLPKLLDSLWNILGDRTNLKAIEMIAFILSIGIVTLVNIKIPTPSSFVAIMENLWYS